MKNSKAIASLLLLLPALLGNQVSAQSLRTLLVPPRNCIESKWEKNLQKDIELNYYNNDFCDYYLFRENDRSYNLEPGKNTVFTRKKDSNVENPFKEASRFIYYRGQFPDNFQVNTPYALPVRSGVKAAWETDPREPFKTLNFHLAEGDTVYATRSGMACITTHPLQLLIYHPDRTFAVYLVMSQNFIHPGDEVQTGQAVGIASSTGASISYFFLDKNKFNGGVHAGYPYSHFMPVFRVTEGDVKLEEKKSYQSATDDALIMQDMSKREQKKYLKNKK